MKKQAEYFISRHKERQLIAEAQKCKNQNINKAFLALVKAYDSFIENRKNKYLYTKVEEDILKNVILIGFYNAVMSFNLKYDNRISTYANWKIKNYIPNVIKEEKLILNISNQKENYPTCSLNVPLKEGQDTTYIDMLQYENEKSAYDIHENNEQIKDLTKAMKLLNIQERNVLKQKYGLNKEKKEYSLTDIGKNYGFSTERARKIHNKGLEKLRNSSTLMAWQNN